MDKPKMIFISNLMMLLMLLFVVPRENVAGDLDLLHEKNFKIGQGKDFILTTDGGDVMVNTWGKNEVGVKIFGNSQAKKRFDFTFESDTGYVKVKGKKHRSSIFNWFSSIKLRYEIMVPRKFNVNLVTAGGDLKIKDLVGEAVLTTSGGDIKAANITGNVSAKTSGGDIRINGVKGEVSAKTSGGDIDCKNISGDLKLKTSGGDIDMKNIDAKVNAGTSGGDINLIFTGENRGIELYTSGGDIRIEVPEDFSADINLKTVGGDISVGLENVKDIKASKYSFTGKVGNGEEPLTAKTTGGDIIVEKF